MAVNCPALFNPLFYQAVKNSVRNWVKKKHDLYGTPILIADSQYGFRTAGVQR